ncbi:hypothetical protein HC026_03345 [Lactobacillus sp. LC28-10]|uniref:Gram-positive cocci surface proteins LPxTG domain-containing protein n=1 Tax=Secundilactobacillus angelensis TaxID=2722706 RepID=A0ABX1KXU9_9LACO|nr:hypothetical protein [Secundilactobacillus angelensis]MCH5461660.1 hypothetical protein [Secundilactobacillus angelensis]NLR17955.1 hypothetical protein [Secundilactobacillus angelensis]
MFKLMMVTLLLFGFAMPVKASASADNGLTLPRMNAQVQVGSHESQIKFWRTDNPHERQVTVSALSVLVAVGIAASWARRKFY